MRTPKPRPLPATLPANHPDYYRERYRPVQAAEYLDESVARIYRLAGDGKLGHRKVGESFRFSQADLDAYREAGRVPAKTQAFRKIAPPVSGHKVDILPEGFKRRFAS